MNKYSDLESSILSCFLQRPKLMKETILDDKYFIKHKNIWLFMKEFYKRFGNFDLTLMMAVSKNKYKILENIIWLIEQEPSSSLFKEYEKLLIQEYKKSQKEKFVVEKIYEMATSLYIGNMKIAEFNENLNKLYKDVKDKFKTP